LFQWGVGHPQYCSQHEDKGTTMETSFINASLINLAVNLSYTVISLFVAVLALLAVDKILLKKLDIQQELANNNLSVAIFCSAVMLFVALIICFGLQS
jgi:hypothetical protein